MAIIYKPNRDQRDDWKYSVFAATAVALPAYVRTGNTLNAVALGAFPLVDGVDVAASPSRRFLLNTGAAADEDKGIYRLVADGSPGTSWSAVRDFDCDASAKISCDMTVAVEAGGTLAGHVFVLRTPDPIVLNTTALTFVDMGTLMANVTAATDGTVNLFGATNGQLLGSDGATAGGVWRNDWNVQPGAITAPTNPTINTGTGALTVGGTLTKNSATDQFAATVVSPVVSQAATAIAGATASNTTIQAQHASDAGGPAANIGGTLNLYGGNAAGPLASAGGAVAIKAGNATAAGVGSVGGSINLTVGTGATAGGVHVLGGAFDVTGTVGAVPGSGARTTCFFAPAKGAFRAGKYTGAVADDANVGLGSVALGEDSRAGGTYSVALGGSSYAAGNNSTAIGQLCTATGLRALAAGFATEASGTASSAFGSTSKASLVGQLSVAGSYFSAVGDAQRSSVGLMRTSTDAGSVELTLDGTAPAAGTRKTIASGKRDGLRGVVSCACISGGLVGESAFWHVYASAANVAGTSALVGTPQVMREGAVSVACNVAATPTSSTAGLATATVQITVSDVNDAWQVDCVGVDSGAENTFHWHFDPYSSEVA